jgi:hypothetical protein
MPDLPPGATQASRERYQLARELEHTYPPELGREIALTGSVSRGVADEDSDIEVVAWADAIPGADARRAWLRAIGGSDFAPEAHTSQDGTVWEWSRYRGVWLETGWQAIGRHEAVLRAILASEVTDHRVLITADATARALPLRSEGLLARWQAQLASYPERLQERLVRAGARRWNYAISYWSLGRRGDRVGAAERLLADVHSILRIVFAVNRVWEPAWKWADQRVEQLDVKPPQLTERVDAILSLADLEGSLTMCAELFLDTLALVPREIDVSAPATNIRRSLRDRTP